MTLSHLYQRRFPSSQAHTHWLSQSVAGQALLIQPGFFAFAAPIRYAFQGIPCVFRLSFAPFEILEIRVF